MVPALEASATMNDCPACAEKLPRNDLETCPHCGEVLKRKGLSTLAIVLIACGGISVLGLGGIAVIAAIAIPNLIEARKHGNEAAAVGALKTISTAQSLFREGDKEGDENFDYGSLDELAECMLVDGVLGSGLKQGFHFQCEPSSTTSEFLWMATADPAVPGTTGDRYFAVNHAGVIFYSVEAPIPLDTVECELPPPGRSDVLPVGVSPGGRRR